MWLWLWGEKSNSSVGFLSLWNTKEEDRFSQSTQSAEGSLNVDDWSAVLPSVCCQVCLKKSFLIGARAGRDLRGHYCFSNYPFFFVPNDHIFHCLNVPQNSTNLEYTSHLPKNFTIYCCLQFPPLGGPIIKESAFWLITHRWRAPFWCFAIKQSTHFNFHIQFAIYSKLLKHVDGLALNTSTWHNLTAACPDTRGLWGPVHCCLQL